MVKKYFLFRFLPICFFLVINTSTGFAQVDGELDFIISNNPIAIPEEKEHRSFTFKETSEGKLFFIGTIRFYQLFISSQQNHQVICIFTPSCSRFGMAAIKKYGAFYGILMASDRLQRCNNFGKKSYPVRQETGKFYDPVEPYFLNLHKLPDKEKLKKDSMKKYI